MPSEKLTRSLSSLFDKNYSRYEAFLELRDQLGTLHKAWREKFDFELRGQFKRVAVIDGKAWNIRPWDGESLGYTFYMEDYGHDSLSFYLNETRWKLWANSGKMNFDELRRITKLPEYRSFFEDGLGVSFNAAWDMYSQAENGKWTFEGSSPSTFTTRIDELIWFVGNYPDKMAKQVIAKLDRVRMNKDLLDKFIQLQEATLNKIA